MNIYTKYNMQAIILLALNKQWRSSILAHIKKTTNVTGSYVQTEKWQVESPHPKLPDFWHC
jgi:hypothetical protein